MKIDLINNNTCGNLIAFVQKGNEKFYCLAEVEYWIGEWWNGYVDNKEGLLEVLYFNYIKQFKLEYSELKFAYYNLIELGNKFKLEGNKPSLFIDFEEKLFVSNFYDQALERRLPKDWIGKYGGVYDNIPKKFRYWEIVESA